MQVDLVVFKLPHLLLMLRLRLLQQHELVQVRLSHFSGAGLGTAAEAHCCLEVCRSHLCNLMGSSSSSSNSTVVDSGSWAERRRRLKHNLRLLGLIGQLSKQTLDVFISKVSRLLLLMLLLLMMLEWRRLPHHR